jgi:hypothetical protein
MFERDDGRALGDSFVERANLKSHLVLRDVLIFCYWIKCLPIRVDHQVLVFLLELQVFNLDVPHLAVK